MESNLQTRMANLAAALADRSRLSMLCALMDAKAYTATELSLVADISPSTASSHLNRLVEQQLIVCIRQGRYRYYQIVDQAVADFIESLMGLAKPAAIPSSTPERLRFARTCYRHLAGTLAIDIAQQCLQHGWIHPHSYALTEGGRLALQARGLTAPPGQAACTCLDWSERQFHIGGKLGACLLSHFMQKKWLTAIHDSRELQLTGKAQLFAFFQLRT
jgi:DNA-binding transcriptional ArsR family regulator